jgi:hypothetical protein
MNYRANAITYMYAKTLTMLVKGHEVFISSRTLPLHDVQHKPHQTQHEERHSGKELNWYLRT